MILPPSGDVGPQYSDFLTNIKALCIKHGMVAVTPEITARADSASSDTKGNSAGLGLTQTSTLGKALALAKSTNIDAVLQIGELKWLQDADRHVLGLDEKTNAFLEISDQKKAASIEKKRTYLSTVLQLKAKLISVETGVVLGIFDIQSSPFDFMPADYTASYKTSPLSMFSSSIPKLEESYEFGATDDTDPNSVVVRPRGEWFETAMQESMNAVAEKFFKLIGR